MTDTELRNGVVKLSETVTQLSQAVQSQAENTTSLSTQVRESNERTEANRKTLQRLSILMGAKLLTLVLILVLFNQVQETNDAIKSCTTPEGQCAQRNAAVTGVALNILADKNEERRISTELPIARIKGDEVRVAELEKELAKIQKKVADNEQLRKNIQSGKIDSAR